MKYRINIIVLASTKVVARIEGQTHFEGPGVDPADYDQLLMTEQHLERLTGLRFHINIDPLPEPSLSEIDRNLQAERDSRRNP